MRVTAALLLSTAIATLTGACNTIPNDGPNLTGGAGVASGEYDHEKEMRRAGYQGQPLRAGNYPSDPNFTRQQQRRPDSAYGERRVTNTPSIFSENGVGIGGPSRNQIYKFFHDLAPKGVVGNEINGLEERKARDNPTPGRITQEALNSTVLDVMDRMMRFGIGRGWLNPQGLPPMNNRDLHSDIACQIAMYSAGSEEIANVVGPAIVWELEQDRQRAQRALEWLVARANAGDKDIERQVLRDARRAQRGRLNGNHVFASVHPDSLVGEILEDFVFRRNSLDKYYSRPLFEFRTSDGRTAQAYYRPSPGASAAQRIDYAYYQVIIPAARQMIWRATQIRASARLNNAGQLALPPVCDRPKR